MSSRRDSAKKNSVLSKHYFEYIFKKNTIKNDENIAIEKFKFSTSHKSKRRKLKFYSLHSLPRFSISAKGHTLHSLPRFSDSAKGHTKTGTNWERLLMAA